MNRIAARNKAANLLATLAILATSLGVTTALSQSPAHAVVGTVSGIVYRDWNYSGNTTNRFIPVNTNFTMPTNFKENRVFPGSTWGSLRWKDSPLTTASIVGAANAATPVALTPLAKAYIRAQEPGEAGIIMTVTDSAGTQWTTTTAADGTFSLGVDAATTEITLDMKIPASKSFLVVGPKGAKSSGNVRRLTLGGTGTQGLYFSVVNPAEFCKHDNASGLRLVTPCWKYGDQKFSTPKSVLDSVPFDQPTSFTPATSTPPQISEATENQIGTTYGLAWDPNKKNLFAAAFMRRHTGFGPGGTGAIYRIEDPGKTPSTKTVSIYADLNTLFGAGTAGIDTHPTGAAGCSGDRAYDSRNPGSSAPMTACQGAWMHDSATYAAVGKSSLGDIDISEDGSMLYVVNLFDRKLYRMSATTAPVTSADVSTLVIPSAASGTTYKCAANDSRPFAVTIHDGVGYLGVVCSKEGGAAVSDLRGYVYKFDPVAMTVAAGAAPVVQFTLDNLASGPMPYRTSANNSPWQDTWRSVYSSTFYSFGYSVIGVQEQVGSIAFDNKDMLIGMRNRYHDQMMDYGFGIDPTDNSTRYITSYRDGGDLHRACPAGSGWAVEGNTTDAPVFNEANCTGGSADGTTFTREGTMYGTNSLYSEMAQYVRGGVVALAGSQSHREELYSSISNSGISGGKLIFPAADPLVLNWTNGMLSLNTNFGWVKQNGMNTASTFTNHDGTNSSIYIHTDSTIYTEPEMGKGNGLGDLEVLCQFAPIDIGDRVWSDNDGDGRQGGAEPSWGLITVSLRQGSSTLATVETDSNGNYLFSSRAGTDTANAKYGLTQLKPGATDLWVKVDIADPQIASGYHLGTTGAGTDRRLDSDGLVDGGTARFAITSGYAQSYDIDFGFCWQGACVANAIFAIGNKVWTDTNSNGVQESGEAGVANVNVDLLDDATGALRYSTLTSSAGEYVFDGLDIGTYKVRFSGLAAGLTFTTPLAGGIAATDSNAVIATGTTATITLNLANPNVRNTAAGDLTVRASKIDPTIDAGTVSPPSSVSTTICLRT
jgi:SdrD B-like domain